MQALPGKNDETDSLQFESFVFLRNANMFCLSASCKTIKEWPHFGRLLEVCKVDARWMRYQRTVNGLLFPSQMAIVPQSMKSLLIK